MCASPGRRCGARATTANCRARNILRFRRLRRPAWLFPATQDSAFERMIAWLDQTTMHADLRDFAKPQLRHHFEQARTVRQEPGDVVLIRIVTADVAHCGRLLR